MRRFSISILAAMLLVGLVAIPAGAEQIEPTGDMVKLFFDDDGTVGNQWTINEGEPFHIIHGHGFLGHGRGNYLLPMTLDGAPLEPDAIKMIAPNKDFWGLTNFDNVSMQRLWNFPDGLEAGRYTVVGTWTYPCAVAVAFGHYMGVCEHPNELWEQGSLTLELTVVASSG
jgi:hypothetical protein